MKRVLIFISLLSVTFFLGAGCQSPQGKQMYELPDIGVQFEYTNSVEKVRDDIDGASVAQSLQIDSQEYVISAIDADGETKSHEGNGLTVRGDYYDLTSKETLAADLSQTGFDYYRIVDVSSERYLIVQKGVYGIYSARLYGVIQGSGIAGYEYTTVAGDWFAESPEDDLEDEIDAYLVSNEFTQFKDFFESVEMLPETNTDEMSSALPLSASLIGESGNKKVYVVEENKYTSIWYQQDDDVTQVVEGRMEAEEGDPELGLIRFRAVTFSPTDRFIVIEASGTEFPIVWIYDTENESLYHLGLEQLGKFALDDQIYVDCIGSSFAQNTPTVYRTEDWEVLEEIYLGDDYYSFDNCEVDDGILVFDVTQALEDTTQQQVIDLNNYFNTTYQNTVYGYEFTYNRDWSLSQEDSYAMYDFDLLDTVSITSVEGNLYQKNGLVFSVVDINFPDLIVNIESSDVLETGESLTAVSDVDTITINGYEAQTGIHQTAIGIPVRFYYVPLSGGQSLFISGYEYDDERSKEIESLLNTLELERSTTNTYTNQDIGVQLSYPGNWVLSELHKTEVYFYDTESGGLSRGVQLYIQPYSEAPEKDTMMLSKKSLLHEKERIKNSEHHIVVNGINIEYMAVGGWPVDPRATQMRAQFFIENDLFSLTWVVGGGENLEETVKIAEMINENSNELSTAVREKKEIMDDIVYSMSKIGN